MDEFKKKISDRGFSLIEMMVTITILGFISVGLFSILNMQLRQMNHFEFVGKRDQLRAVIAGQFLTNSENCRCLFNSASNFQVAGTKNLQGYAEPNAIGLFQTPGCTLSKQFINRTGFDGLRLDSVGIRNITAISGSQAGELIVGVSNHKNLSGPEILPISIPVIVNTLPTTNPNIVRFAGCSIRNEGFNLESLLLTVQDFETTACLWTNDVHEVIARCPANRALIACAGGPGDQDESREGHFILPNYTTNTCTLTVAMPRCNGPARPHTYQKVVASCYLRP